MAANDPLDVDAGWIVRKDQKDPIAVAGWMTRDEGQSAGDGSDMAEGPSNHAGGESFSQNSSQFLHLQRICSDDANLYKWPSKMSIFFLMLIYKWL
eukprot:g39368.t1